MKKILLLAQLLVFVICANAQVLYSTTLGGGTSGLGTIFSYNAATGSASMLYSFNSAGGGTPRGSLLHASDGKLYGLTFAYGANFSGTLFSFDPATGAYSNLFDFGGLNGRQPKGHLIEASDGNFYGTTDQGGALDRNGVLFRYNPITATFTPLYSFSSYHSENLLEVDGRLYGTTALDGTFGYGTIFSFDFSNDSYRVIYNFTESSGAGGSDLLRTSDGRLFGTTRYNYDNNRLFSFDPVHHIFEIVTNLSATTAAGMTLIQASDGKIYGVGTDASRSFGEIFSYDITNSSYAIEKIFPPEQDFPEEGLFEASDGMLYGNTGAGGDFNGGTSYVFDPVSKSFSTVINFRWDSAGRAPTAVFIELCTPTTYYRDADGDGFGDPANAISSCSATPPPGYVANNTDCDDTKLLYADNDGDGYGAGSPGACGVANHSDCNDSNAGIHPGAIEVCGNGIDDNCNGQIDEGCTVSEGVKVSIANSLAFEGNNGLRFMKFKLSLNKRSRKFIWVTFTTEDGTATAGSDYQSQTGTVIVQPGDKEAWIKIFLLGDRIPEPDETFTVRLTGAFNAAIENGIATGTIVNDDGSMFSQSTEHLKSNTVSTQAVEVMPNPASDMAKIKLTGFSGNVQLQLRSFDGRLLHHEKIFTSGKTTEYQINVSNYASGTYLLTAIGEDGKKQSLKLIITR